MDVDVFPTALEYWGPSGTVDFRNVQVRWMPIRGDTRLTFAVERPGGSGDEGLLADCIELQNVQARFPMPDFSGRIRRRGRLGLRRSRRRPPPYPARRSARRWFRSRSVDLRVGRQPQLEPQADRGGHPPPAAGVRRGHGELHERSPPPDVGIERNPGGGPTRPIKGAALPLIGLVAFLEHKWNARWSSTVGYSLLDIDNTEGQTPAAFNEGHYALGNLLYTPVRNVMVGGELQYGRRENSSDGFSSDDFRIQFSFKYNFSVSLGGP